jgi:protein-disulfide isomerase
MRLAAWFLFALSAWAQTSPPAVAKPSAGNPKFDKAAFEASLRYYEALAPDIAVKVGDPKPAKSLPGFFEIPLHLSYGQDFKDEIFYLSSDGQTVIPAESGPVPAFRLGSNPFQLNLDQLVLTDQPSFGPADAPVTIVEFGDLECPSCKAEAPVLRNLLPMFYPDKVRVVFKDFPLESVHPWARAASDAARCVYRQNSPAFWKVYDWFYENQEQISAETLTPKVLDWAGKNGIDAVQLGRCIETKASDADVARNLAEARALNLKGTPTLFINGRKSSGVDFQVLQQIIEIELKRPH